MSYKNYKIMYLKTMSCDILVSKCKNTSLHLKIVETSYNQGILRLF